METLTKILVIVSLSFTLLYLGAFLKGESQCFAAGYSKVRIDVMLNTYCGKRVNQTDIVIPLGDIS